MTTCYLAPDPIQSTQFIPGGAVPANGGQLFFYAAGSSTKQTVYKDNAANTAWSNPIVLDSGGNLPSGGEVWFPAGQTFKVVFAPSTDTDPPTSPYWTKDNLAGMNDTSVTGSEWLSGPAPTYVSATSFTLSGDQTGTFTVGRRLKFTVTAGTVYGTITASSYAALTTVTVATDSGSLDSGLSSVFYGLLAATNRSIPPMGELIPLGSVSGTNTITASGSVQAAALVTSQAFIFTPSSTNTGSTTININSLGAKNVFSMNAACVGSEMVTGVPAILMYDGTQFQLANPASKIVNGAVQSSTGVTSRSFSIPSWVKRITLNLSGVSINGNTEMLFQIGDAGGIENSGYVGASLQVANGNSVTGGNPTGSWRSTSVSSTAVYNGSVIISLLDPATFTWACIGNLFRSDSAAADYFGGSKALSQALTTVQIASNNGTSTFNAGSVNVLYE